MQKVLFCHTIKFLDPKSICYQRLNTNIADIPKVNAIICGFVGFSLKINIPATRHIIITPIFKVGNIIALGILPASKVLSILTTPKQHPANTGKTFTFLCSLHSLVLEKEKAYANKAANKNATTKKPCKFSLSLEDWCIFCIIPSAPEESIAIKFGIIKLLPTFTFLPPENAEAIIADIAIKRPKIDVTVKVSFQNNTPDTVGKINPNEYTIAQIEVGPLLNASVDLLPLIHRSI